VRMFDEFHDGDFAFDFLKDRFAELLAIDDFDGHFLAGHTVNTQLDQTRLSFSQRLIHPIWPDIGPRIDTAAMTVPLHPPLLLSLFLLLYLLLPLPLLPLPLLFLLLYLLLPLLLLLFLFLLFLLLLVILLLRSLE